MAPYVKRSVAKTAVAAIFMIYFVAANAAPPTDADCTSDVPFADLDLCSSYYQCFNVESSWVLVHLDCPTGGIWDDVNKACVAGTCEVTTITTIAPTTTETIAPTTTTIAPTTTETIAPTTSTTTTTPTIPPTAPSQTTTVPPDLSSSSTPVAITTTSAPSSSVTSSASETSSTPTTTSQNYETTTTTSGPPTFVCTSIGFFAHPTDPAKYYRCVLIGAQFYYYIYTCPPSACFQQSAGTCVLGSCSSTNTTVAPPKTTTAVVTSPPVDIICDTQGQYPFPGSCTKYYNCILLNDGFVYYVFECPPGSYFNGATSLCTTGQCPSTSATSAATTSPSKTTAVATTTTTAAPDHPCPTEGYFVDPADCQAYYRCIIISGQMYRYMFRCPAGSYWNSNLQGCIVGACPTVIGRNLT